MKAKKGSKVKVEYTGKFEDGTIFDSSKNHGQPLEFEVGAGMVVPGFDNAVLGMEKGEEKEVTIPAKEAYGEHTDELVKDVPKNKMPEGVEEGMVLGMSLPNGHQIPARVVQVTDSHVKIDLNHPLAGKTLIFEIKLVEISS